MAGSRSRRKCGIENIGDRNGGQGTKLTSDIVYVENLIQISCDATVARKDSFDVSTLAVDQRIVPLVTVLLLAKFLSFPPQSW